MRITSLAIRDVYLIELMKFKDARGFFSEVYSKKSFSDVAMDFCWVQDNHALSKQTGTLRGLHFQWPPHSQAKLIRVSRGAVFDVAVDIRQGSPSFGQWVGAVISAASWNAMLVPKGFAHGYLTLAPYSEIQYKVDAYYAPDHEGGIAWDDPDLAIDWPLRGTRPLLSTKDKNLPSFADFHTPFVHGS